MSAPLPPTPPDAESLSIQMLRQPEVHANPYPFYARLRAKEPVHFEQQGARGMGVWILSRYADVRTVLVGTHFTAERFTPSIDWMPDDLKSTLGAALLAIGHQLLFIDPPEHTRLRGIVNHAFVPRIIEVIRPHVREIVERMLDEVRGQATVDVMSALAVPLPITVICEILGVPVVDREQVGKWSNDFAALLSGNPLSLEELLAALQGVSDMMRYLRGVYQEHESQPRDDLMQAFIAAEEHGQTLTEEEILANLVLLFAAGHVTTTHLIGNGTLALLRHPEQLERLRADAKLMPNAVNELLRYDAPVQMTSRQAREAVTIGEMLIPAGAPVTVLLAAANRDPAQFPDPDALDLARPDVGKLLSFGYGPHFCLGAPLARLEAGIAFGALLERYPSMRLVSDSVEHIDSPVFRGLTALPVAVG